MNPVKSSLVLKERILFFTVGREIASVLSDGLSVGAVERSLQLWVNKPKLM